MVIKKLFSNTKINPSHHQYLQQGNCDQGPSLNFFLLERLIQDTPISCKPDATVSILDGAVIVHMVKPQAVRLFPEYVQIQFIPYIKTQLRDVEKLDVIWDQYPLTSLKQHTREFRGAGTPSVSLAAH